MTAPRLAIDLGKIEHNARSLVARLVGRGVSVTGVTKAMLGAPAVARAMLRAGVRGLGDARIENIETMRRAGIAAPMTLIRSPMPSQVQRVVAHADASFNTELEVIAMLASAAQEAGATHRVVLMVELGDLREGIMPGDLEAAVLRTLGFRNIVLEGIGTNLACRSGVTPDARNMAALSALAGSIEARVGCRLEVVSGGGSANLPWALGGNHSGRINDLRLGEAILLGREPLQGRPIEGLHTDAVTLVAEVIEAKTKPSRPWGEIAQAAFGKQSPARDRGPIAQTILAVGHQDTDPDGLTPPAGIAIIGASSDHLVIDAGGLDIDIGAEITFQLTYGALLRAMTSPFIGRVLVGDRHQDACSSSATRHRHRAGQPGLRPGRAARCGVLEHACP